MLKKMVTRAYILVSLRFMFWIITVQLYKILKKCK